MSKYFLLTKHISEEWHDSVSNVGVLTEDRHKRNFQLSRYLGKMKTHNSQRHQFYSRGFFMPTATTEIRTMWTLVRQLHCTDCKHHSAQNHRSHWASMIQFTQNNVNVKNKTPTLSCWNSVHTLFPLPDSENQRLVHIEDPEPSVWCNAVWAGPAKPEVQLFEN